ncbi:hypothetical protein AVEN_216089-1 [Araneus ventricosus]|uniref:CRISP/Allergen/PR-1 n=1 Tax=Araneus ventricosus TaxID=182803 RepID=A0A4Y2IZC5_ARAVE|nr:hypothetical protein AVEN_216089-1 [Araneus ventricosus]
MNHQLTAIVALFITVVASCNACYHKKFTPNHTACKPRNSSCNILDNKVTKDDKELVVRLHNEKREKVAMGRETAAGGLPTASNMMEMVSGKNS